MSKVGERSANLGELSGDRSDKRFTILAAAQEVFAEYGFHRAKVETIAERASVAKGTVYLYFTSKKELLTALMEDRMSRLARLIEATMCEECGILEMIEGIIKAHFLFYHEEKEFITILYGQLGQIAEGMEGPAKRGSEALTDMVSGVMKHGVETGLLQPVCVQTLAQALQGMIHAVAFDWVVKCSSAPPETLAKEVYELFCWGAVASSQRV